MTRRGDWIEEPTTNAEQRLKGVSCPYPRRYSEMSTATATYTLIVMFIGHNDPIKVSGLDLKTCEDMGSHYMVANGFENIPGVLCVSDKDGAVAWRWMAHAMPSK